MTSRSIQKEIQSPLGPVYSLSLSVLPSQPLPTISHHGFYLRPFSFAVPSVGMFCPDGDILQRLGSSASHSACRLTTA